MTARPMLQDLKYSLRQLGRQPSFTIIAGLTLALGIGVSTALFSVIDAALLRPLPYPNPEELVTPQCEGGQRRQDRVTTPPRWKTFAGGERSIAIIAHAGMGRVSGFGHAHRRDRHAAASHRRGSLRRFSRDLRHHADSWPRHSGGRHARRRSCRGAARPRLLATGIRRRSECARPRRPRSRTGPSTIVGVLPAGFYPETAVWQATQFSNAMARSTRFGYAGDRATAAGRDARQARAALDAVTPPAVLRGPAPVQFAW